MKKKLGIAAALLLAVPLGLAASLSADRSFDLAAYDAHGDLARLAQPAPPTPSVSVALSLVNTGSSTSPEATVFGGGSWLKDYKSVYAAVVVRHPKGTVLFETGLGSKIDAEVAGNSVAARQIFKYDKGKPVAEQLQGAAVPPGEVKAIILSHLHWDHAGGINDFPEAEVYVPRVEQEHALASSRPVFIHEQLDGPQTKWHFVEFAATPYENFETSFDLYGDGTLVLVPLPGHTPGSLGMFVNLSSGKRYFFTGDLTWAKEGLTVPTERPWLPRRLVDFDPAAVRASIAKVHTLMAQRPSLLVLPSHDDRAQAGVAKFPTFEQ